MEALGLYFTSGMSALAFVAVWVLSVGHRSVQVQKTSRIQFPARKGRRNDAQLQTECLREMPIFLDILSLGLSVGLSFDASLELYCQRGHNGLSRELQSALFQWRCGLKSRDEALHELAVKLRSPTFKRFADAVSEALMLGTPLGETLQSQRSALREEQRLAAEERIEKVPIKMLIPLGTLVVPAMMLAILGPLLGSSLSLG